jgi:hypothetical protein
MSRQRKIAITFILVGVCLPLFLLFFVSGYDPNASLSWNVNYVEIVFRDKHWAKPTEFDETLDNLSGIIMRDRYHRFGSMILKPKIAIRYKTVILFSIFLIFIGTGLMPLSRKEEEQ